MRAPQGCLNCANPSTRPDKSGLAQGKRLEFRQNHFSTLKLSDTHPRGCPTIHLSKNETINRNFFSFAIVNTTAIERLPCGSGVANDTGPFHLVNRTIRNFLAALTLHSSIPSDRSDDSTGDDSSQEASPPLSSAAKALKNG